MVMKILFQARISLQQHFSLLENETRAHLHGHKLLFQAPVNSSKSLKSEPTTLQLKLQYQVKFSRRLQQRQSFI